MKTKIELIDLWYLDGNYNKPVKTQGFKSLVKSDRYYKEDDGYVFIEPVSKAFMVSKNRDCIFEKEEDANYHLKNQLKSHIEFAKRQIKEYTEDLQKWGAL